MGKEYPDQGKRNGGKHPSAVDKNSVYCLFSADSDLIPNF